MQLCLFVLLQLGNDITYFLSDSPLKKGEADGGGIVIHHTIVDDNDEKLKMTTP